MSRRVEDLAYAGTAIQGTNASDGANHASYVWVDRYNTFGLGANVPIASANGSEPLLALINGELVNLRNPNRLGFFTKNIDGRIDDGQIHWPIERFALRIATQETSAQAREQNHDQDFST